MKLEVGKKYRYKNNISLSYFDSSLLNYYIEVICVKEDYYWVKGNDGHYWTETSQNNLIPYEEPVKEVEWKTFLVEFSDFKCIGMYLSAEAAQSQNPKAISITEIKLNFETV